MTLVNIPRLDLQQYTQGSAEDRQKFIQDLGRAFNETGFVTIANHGLSQELIDELYSVVKAFFDLPEEIKPKTLKFQTLKSFGNEVRLSSVKNIQKKTFRTTLS